MSHYESRRQIRVRRPLRSRHGPARVWAREEGEDDVKNCYSVHGEARYGALAYKHVVIVTNRCDITLQCQVWTDVDPSPKQSVSVGPKGTGEVIVRNNSPARGFKAFGECKK